MTSPFFFRDRVRRADFALRNRVVSMFAFREWVKAGGLLSYGPSITGMVTIPPFLLAHTDVVIE